MKNTPSPSGRNRTRLRWCFEDEMLSVRRSVRSTSQQLRRIRLDSYVLFCGVALFVQSNVSMSQSTQVAWPDPLVLQSGKAVHNRSDFERLRRPEILQLFEENVFGRTPSTSMPVRVLRTEVDAHALHGLARRTQITLAVGTSGQRIWHLLEYIPANVHRPAPVFIGLNFDGNQTVDVDPGINLNPVWVPDPGLKNQHLAKELSRHVLITPSADSRGGAASPMCFPMTRMSMQTNSLPLAFRVSARLRFGRQLRMSALRWSSPTNLVRRAPPYPIAGSANRLIT